MSIFSADDYEPIMEMLDEWIGAFDITVYPAVSAEQGLTIGDRGLRPDPRMNA